MRLDALPSKLQASRPGTASTTRSAGGSKISSSSSSSSRRRLENALLDSSSGRAVGSKSAGGFTGALVLPSRKQLGLAPPLLSARTDFSLSKQKVAAGQEHVRAALEYRHKQQSIASVELQLREKILSSIGGGPFELHRAFRKLHPGKGSAVRLDDFYEAVSKFGLGLGAAQIRQLFSAFDRNADGGIDYQEFVKWISDRDLALSGQDPDLQQSRAEYVGVASDGGGLTARKMAEAAHRVNETHRLISKSYTCDQLHTMLRERLLAGLRPGQADLLRAYRSLKRGDCGGARVTQSDLSETLSRLGADISEDKVTELFRRYDVNQNGQLDFYEFVDRIMESDELPPVVLDEDELWTTSTGMRPITAPCLSPGLPRNSRSRLVLWRQLGNSFKRQDPAGVGTVSVGGFHMTLREHGLALGRDTPITETESRALAAQYARQGGRVDYLRFLQEENPSKSSSATILQPLQKTRGLSRPRSGSPQKLESTALARAVQRAKSARAELRTDLKKAAEHERRISPSRLSPGFVSESTLQDILTSHGLGDDIKAGGCLHPLIQSARERYAGGVVPVDAFIKGVMLLPAV
jgi:Ca2+-binding EF-hand superfamily protein